MRENSMTTIEIKDWLTSRGGWNNQTDKDAENVFVWLKMGFTVVLRVRETPVGKVKELEPV